jgi:hypothetical protein
LIIISPPGTLRSAAYILAMVRQALDARDDHAKRPDLKLIADNTGETEH